MRIRLIQPSQLDDNGTPLKYRTLFLPFLTLATVVALTPDGVEVGITDEYVATIDFDEDIDLAAVTSQTCQAPRAYEIAAEFRKRGTRTLLGGIHASMCTQEALEHFDIVLAGEAEEIWAQVLGDVNRGDPKRLYQAPRYADLSRLTIPRFDLIDYGKYMVPPFARTPLIPLQTTRGCPHSCDFCSVASFAGQTIRRKPVRNVIREIETIRPSRVFFTDDNILADPDYARDLFNAMKGLRLRWACQMSTEVRQYPELVELAAASGCHETFVGIESLSPDNLRTVHKSFNHVETYADTFRRLADVGILAQVSLIFGLDHDTVTRLRDTVHKVMEWDVNYLYINLLTPFPGTRLHERMREANRIRHDNWSLYDGKHVLVQPQRITASELEECVWYGYRTFYSRRHILGRAWRFKKQYVRFFPRDNVIEELFFQHHMRRCIRRHVHPFSLGET